MKTSSFFLYDGPGRISISRAAPRNSVAGFRVFKLLAPGPWFNSVPRDVYERLYAEQLAELNAQAVWDRLHILTDGHEPVLLCYEKPPFTATNWCHRRLVAAWFHEQLGHSVDELGST